MRNYGYEETPREVYTIAELGQWVHLLTKRAENRTNFAKKDQDLLDAQNYLSMMQSKLNEVKQVTLEKFSMTILIHLDENLDAKLTTDKASDVSYITWKIMDSDPVRGFEDTYNRFVKPALNKLSNGLKDLDVIHELEIDREAASPGAIISIIKYRDICARLTTSYDSDGGWGSDAGVIMKIEVGI